MKNNLGFFSRQRHEYRPESGAIGRTSEAVERVARTATNMAMNFFPYANREAVYFELCDLFTASGRFDKARAATDPSYEKSIAFETGVAVAEHAFYDNPRSQSLFNTLVGLNTAEGLCKFNDLMISIQEACFENSGPSLTT